MRGPARCPLAPGPPPLPRAPAPSPLLLTTAPAPPKRRPGQDARLPRQDACRPGQDARRSRSPDPGQDARPPRNRPPVADGRRGRPAGDGTPAPPAPAVAAEVPVTSVHWGHPRRRAARTRTWLSHGPGPAQRSGSARPGRRPPLVRGPPPARATARDPARAGIRPGRDPPGPGPTRTGPESGGPCQERGAPPRTRDRTSEQGATDARVFI